MNGVTGVAGRYLGHAYIDIELTSDGAVRLDGHFLKHQPACFGPNGGDRRLLTAENNGDAITAFWECDGKEEWLVARTSPAFNRGRGIEIKAWRRLGVDGQRRKLRAFGRRFPADECLRVRDERAGKYYSGDGTIHPKALRVMAGGPSTAHGWVSDQPG